MSFPTLVPELHRCAAGGSDGRGQGELEIRAVKQNNEPVLTKSLAEYV